MVPCIGLAATPPRSIPLILYVRSGCPFSALAVKRVAEACAEDPRVSVAVRDADRACEREDVPVTPVVLLPNGARLIGTPSAERLRRVLVHFYGASRVATNKVWYLERNRLFRGIPAGEIEKFAHLFRESDHRAGSVIFHEGDLGDAIYLLKRGHVRLYRVTEDGREATLAVLGPGDVFGELALFEETQRTTVAEVMDEAHICAASVEDFTALMRRRPQLTMMVAREIARRRSESETRIAGTAFATVRGRIVRVLQHLADEHGEALPDGGVRIPLRLSHQQIASFAGASRESCTIELGRLQRSGIIDIDEAHRFVLRKPAKLKPTAIDALLRKAFG